VGSYRNTKKLGGEKEMRVSSKSVGLLLLLTTIALVMVPVAYTTKPTEVFGIFDTFIPDLYTEEWVRGDNIITHQWGGGGTLSGIWEGTWIHDEWNVLHLDTMIMTVKGVWDTPYGVTFNAPGGPFFGTVHVRYTATVDLVTGVLQGRYAILSGTGELANLRGQGTISANVYSEPLGIIDYILRYHFEPG
jgi:hypothetical protein